MCRAAEAEKERLSTELEHVWAELSSVVRAVYHLDNNSSDADSFDSDRLTALVNRQVSVCQCQCQSEFYHGSNSYCNFTESTKAYKSIEANHKDISGKDLQKRNVFRCQWKN